MIKILNKHDCFILVLPDNTKIEFQKCDINESKKLLETVVYAMGINTDEEKIQIVVE